MRTDLVNCFAALPVGAQNLITAFGKCFLYKVTNPFTTVVFPVPGPPVRIATPGHSKIRKAFL